jgi:hypothetical protein
MAELVEESEEKQQRARRDCEAAQGRDGGQETCKGKAVLNHSALKLALWHAERGLIGGLRNSAFLRPARGDGVRRGSGADAASRPLRGCQTMQCLVRLARLARMSLVPLPTSVANVGCFRSSTPKSITLHRLDASSQLEGISVSSACLLILRSPVSPLSLSPYSFPLSIYCLFDDAAFSPSVTNPAAPSLPPPTSSPLVFALQDVCSTEMRPARLDGIRPAQPTQKDRRGCRLPGQQRAVHLAPAARSFPRVASMRFCPTLFSSSRSIHVSVLSRPLLFGSLMEGQIRSATEPCTTRPESTSAAKVRPPNRLIGECQPSAAVCSYYWCNSASSSIDRAALHHEERGEFPDRYWVGCRPLHESAALAFPASRTRTALSRGRLGMQDPEV